MYMCTCIDMTWNLLVIQEINNGNNEYCRYMYNHFHISTAYVVAHNKPVCMGHIAKANLCNPHDFVIYNQVHTMHTVIKSNSSEIYCIYIYIM